MAQLYLQTKLRGHLDAAQRERLYQARLAKSHRTLTIALLGRRSRTESASSTPTLVLRVRAAGRSRQLSASSERCASALRTRIPMVIPAYRRWRSPDVPKDTCFTSPSVSSRSAPSARARPFSRATSVLATSLPPVMALPPSGMGSNAT